ncbi:protein turtle homolog B-like [Ornithodoros turicata]|uniref:protein turtle homolog B-like n=1 Tax=Ornithodoros turicata TaxID=34597 RepID=UPI0031386F43
MLCRFLLWMCTVVVQCRIQGPANKEQPFASIVYTAVVRGKVALPCDISPPSPDDSVTLVLWYKDESLEPIYTLDSRRGHLDQAKQSSLPTFEHRAFFNMANEPAFLQIDPVEEFDAGEYRCRVDFRRGRSINTIINLKVIVPPGDPIILDDEGRRLEGLAGRFNEGDNLRLVCEVEGGKPRPVVTWWRDKRLVDDNFTFSEDGTTARNKYEIKELRRSDFLTVLACQAANNNVTMAVSRSITLDMNLIPLDVTIQPPNRPLSADQELELVCTSSGSRPPALLTWWKGGEQLISSKEHQMQEGLSTSSSVIIFTPRAEDNGQVLSCRAENQFIAGSAIEEGWKLDVFYTPRVMLQLGQNLKAHDIQEGNDVYLECLVDASPPASEVAWFFGGREVITDLSAGVIISNQSFVLQKVRRSHRGHYTCAAVNREGRGVSNVFTLRVKFAPMCKAHQKRMYGVSRRESISVRCELEADPGEVTFHWRFNSSSSGKRLDLASYSNTFTQSTTVYTPESEDDYGYLLCWGVNEVGKQIRPCNFTVIPAGPPEPVSNCTQVNATEDAVSFECVWDAWDGGVSPVTYQADVYDADFGVLLANASSTGSPSFTFEGLPGGTTFRVDVYSVNAKGRRTPHRVMVNTLRPAEKLTAGSQNISIIAPVVGALTGIVLTLILAVVVILLCLRYSQQGNAKVHKEDKKEDKHTSLMKKGIDEYVELDEKGPDIIPSTPLSKTHFSAQEDEVDQRMACLKEPMSTYYNLTVQLKDNSASGACYEPKYTSNVGPCAYEMSYAELPVQKPALSSDTAAAGHLKIQSEQDTEYANVDFKRTAALRPLPPGHEIPGTRADAGLQEGVRSTPFSETPAPSGNRMESTV